MPAANSATVYEWVAEGIDENGDVDDIHFTDCYADALTAAAQLKTQYNSADVGIMRRVYDWTGDLLDEQFAYVHDGELETEFDGGVKVPQRFIAEVQRTVG